MGAPDPGSPATDFSRWGGAASHLGTWDTSNLSSPKTSHAIPPSEQGYILLFAIFLTALLVIALAIAAPQVAKSIQRDKELESFNRGMQYRRAIQLYYRKFSAYPPSIDALVETNNIRFLRKKYVDPMTGKDDWKPILFGQNKAPTALGFFGQPLAGGATTIAGTGPGGGNTPGGGPGGPILPGGISNLFGGGSTTDTSNNNSTGGANNPNGSSTDSSGNPSGTVTNGVVGSSINSNQPGQSSQSGQSGQTFGGAGIIGIRLPIEKKSILVYKKKDHYIEWEFTYDPISDQQTMGGANPANPMGNGLNGQNPTNNSGIGNNGSGSNGSGGYNGTSGNSSFGGNSASGGSSTSGGSSPTPYSSTPQQ